MKTKEVHDLVWNRIKEREDILCEVKQGNVETIFTPQGFFKKCKVKDLQPKLIQLEFIGDAQSLIDNAEEEDD